MKRTLLLLTVGAILSNPAFGQASSGGAASTNPPPPKAHEGSGGPPPDGRMGASLTPGERDELKAARQAAMQANPDLVQEMRALQEKINAAMIKADPKVAPIIAKLEAARQRRDGQEGPKPPAPGN